MQAALRRNQGNPYFLANIARGAVGSSGLERGRRSTVGQPSPAKFDPRAGRRRCENNAHIGKAPDQSDWYRRNFTVQATAASRRASAVEPVVMVERLLMRDPADHQARATNLASAHQQTTSTDSGTSLHHPLSARLVRAQSRTRTLLSSGLEGPRDHPEHCRERARVRFGKPVSRRVRTPPRPVARPAH